MINIPKQKQVKIEKIRIDKDNPNEMDKKTYNALKKNIKKYGFLVPIITNKDNLIADGEHRYWAAKDLNMNEVPVIKINISDVDRRIIRQVMNKLKGTHKRDKDAFELQRILKEISEDNLKELLAIKDKDISKILDSVRETKEDEFDAEKSLKKPKYKVKKGDIWKLGNHRLMCGDATKEEDVDKLMNGKKADMVFTDPPYSVNFEKKTKEIFNDNSYNKIQNDELGVKEISNKIWRPSFKNMYEIAKDDCSFYMTMPQGGDQMMMMMMMGEHWLVKHELIWVKQNAVFSMNRLDYDYQHEPIMYGWKKKHNFYGEGKYTKSIWKIDRDTNKLHPTMKPLELIGNAILNSSLKDNIIIDFFGGSGSTLISCEQLNRICYMMEIDPIYCSVIIERWEQFTNKKAKKL